jgi:hypothetical protein
MQLVMTPAPSVDRGEPGGFDSVTLAAEEVA